MGALEGNSELSDNDWEAVKRGGDAAIKRWIDDQMSGRSCAVVLVGSETASRPWIKYEIEKAWNDRRGVVGIRVHRLLNNQRQSATAGANPFAAFNVNGTPLSSIVPLHDPVGVDSQGVYGFIRNNIAAWVESAITTRSRYS